MVPSLLQLGPLAITEAGWQAVLAAYEQAIQSRDAAPLKSTYVTSVRDGVAVIPVKGPLFRDENFLTFFGLGTAYETLARDFTSAMNSDEVKGILLDANSPGGAVSGCSEMSKLIFEARGKKPIIAYVDGEDASGCYWLTSSADKVVISRTSLLGSIGVIWAGYDDSKFQEAIGIRTRKVVSSVSPLKDFDPAKDADLARMKRTLDALAEVFVADVARNRGVAPTKVLKDFGKGDVLVGAAAVKAGLADEIGSFEDVLAALASGSTTTSPSVTPPRAAATQAEATMAMKCKKCEDEIGADDDAFCKKCMDGDGDEDDGADADALGLDAKAGRPAIRAAIAALAGFRTQLAALTGKATLPEIVGVVSAWRESSGRVAELAAQQAADAQAVLDRDVAALLERGRADRKLAPAQITGWAPSFIGGNQPAGSFAAACKIEVAEDGKITVTNARREGLAALRSFLEHAPALVATTVHTPPAADAIVLTEEEKRFGAKMGVTEAQMIETKREQLEAERKRAAQ